MRAVYLCLGPQIHSCLLVDLEILVFILEVDYVLDVAFLIQRSMLVVFANYFAKRTSLEHLCFHT